MLAEGAGSAVKFDAGLGSAAPRRREFLLLDSEKDLEFPVANV